ncbi:MAG: hypothetical protein GTN84_04480 [Hydrogenophaga sp.]|uniref:hypothetical protein n=1 Tax=Hydrogenophaga sp. TaxID=1904254 RepID=UPI00168EC556|nr:hypothetical protein [Hydrogenophaga sp.]NIM42637.1 hypothetical protein [Hydrogenophaga sp.]NIN25680.1 hypothetical protein [Hydrogenophaga sp.]NIN30342.1 hypothetical protein [Hydrogenophaga sp.]NIN56682.1 hypothetical protein [Hydrogenophaga sp.]NIO53257.1 hypothetical protein [Hydrogenophaga sp.]
MSPNTKLPFALHAMKRVWLSNERRDEPSEKRLRAHPSSTSDAADRHTPPLRPHSANLQLPQDVVHHIGSALLPPFTPADASLDLHPWAKRVIAQARDGVHASQVCQAWQTGMRHAMNELLTIVARAWLATGQPQAWRHSCIASEPVILVPSPPTLFTEIPNFRQLAQRAEALLLRTAGSAKTWMGILNALLEQSEVMAQSEEMPRSQIGRLRELPRTLLAVLYPRGLLDDPALFQQLTLSLLSRWKTLDPALRLPLLRDIQAVARPRYETEFPELVEQIERSLNEELQRAHVPYPYGWLANALDGANVNNKRAYIEAFTSAPMGPYCIQQLGWIAHHWTEPELRALIVESFSELLSDAVKGVPPDAAFPAPFLLDLAPPDVLQDAFKHLDGEDQATLLKLQQPTLVTNQLVLDFLADPDVERSLKSELMNWLLPPPQ